MARRAHPREDLIRDATALRERVELRWYDPPQVLVVGFRSGGAASFFFGEDPAIHFNSEGELRRLYLDGMLYKAEQGRWIQLRRQRKLGQSLLLSQPLNDHEAKMVLERISFDLQLFAERLSCSSTITLRSVPEGADVRGRVAEWLRQRLGQPLRIASRPHVN